MNSVSKFASGEVAKKCIEEIKASTDEGPSDGKCGFTAMKMKMCIVREMFKACPEDAQDKSEKCVELREAINSGKPIHRKEPRSAE